MEDLLQHADAAMYRGKHGPAGVVVHETGTQHQATHALVMQRELREALENHELVLNYQPKIELATGRVSGVEALVRWQHPRRGLLAPSEFLPVAERSELIEPLTEWVLVRALTDYTAWTAAGLDWTVAINISARNLESSTFPDRVRHILQERGVSPRRIHIEVTETALAFDNRLAGDSFDALATQGISMSIDDFGIGYTSLSQLRTLKVSEVKIDQTFVVGLPGNREDRAIVRSVIDLGHNLGCTVTAEGVERQDVADWLRDAGCDHAQGYLWMRPRPWTEVERAISALPAATTPVATAPEGALAWVGPVNERES